MVGPVLTCLRNNSITAIMALESYHKAKLCLENGELDESFKLFTAFIDDPNSLRLDEELTDSYNARGHIRYLWVDFDDAIKDYTAAIKRNPDFAVAHYNRGQVHYRLGELLLLLCGVSNSLVLGGHQ